MWPDRSPGPPRRRPGFCQWVSPGPHVYDEPNRRIARTLDSCAPTNRHRDVVIDDALLQVHHTNPGERNWIHILPPAGETAYDPPRPDPSPGLLRPSGGRCSAACVAVSRCRRASAWAQYTTAKNEHFKTRRAGQAHEIGRHLGADRPMASSISIALPQVRPSGLFIAVTSSTVGPSWSVPSVIMAPAGVRQHSTERSNAPIRTSHPGRVRSILRQLLRHDARRDQRDALYSGRGITRGGESAICRSDLI